tara:strand:+ start:5001 stop:6032 length:1032 start_codon:yes stop_codon:yes gene_type:complete
MEELIKIKEQIEPLLTIFFDDKIARASKIDPSSKEMIELLKEFTLRGGKRIRAALVYHGYTLFQPPNNEILKPAMATELIHSFLLIHDDIIDQDNTRRNGPTIHASYEKLFNSKHYGTSFAILAGDILHAFANEILANSNFPDKNKNLAIKSLNTTVTKVIYGESLDVLSSINPNFSKKDLELTHYLKTASYTVEGPLHLGAILAGATEEQLKILSKYGIPLGKAFQLQDDILGLFGDEEKLGKPVGSDIKEGKKTLLILKALESATEEQKQFLQSTLNKKDITKEEIDRVRDIVKQTKSLEHSQTTAKQLIQEAKEAITPLKDSESKQFLIELADYMLERTI